MVVLLYRALAFHLVVLKHGLYYGVVVGLFAALYLLLLARAFQIPPFLPHTLLKAGGAYVLRVLGECSWSAWQNRPKVAEFVVAMPARVMLVLAVLVALVVYEFVYVAFVVCAYMSPTWPPLHQVVLVGIVGPLSRVVPGSQWACCMKVLAGVYMLAVYGVVSLGLGQGRGEPLGCDFYAKPAV